MFENSARGPAGPHTALLIETAQKLRTLLGDAERALAAGETVEAERQAKAVSAVVRAARDVAELEAFARAEAPEENDEDVRAEIRRRIARFIDADRAGHPAEELDRLAREAFEE